VHGLALSENSTHLVADLFNNLPPRDGTKKGAKLYGVAAAAMKPGVAAAASNAGVALLTTDVVASRAVAGLPRVGVFRGTAAAAATPRGGREGASAAMEGGTVDLVAESSGDGGGGDLLRMDSATLDARCASAVLVVSNKLVGVTFEAAAGEGSEDAEGANGEGAAMRLQQAATGTVALPLAVRQVARCAVSCLTCLMQLPFSPQFLVVLLALSSACMPLCAAAKATQRQGQRRCRSIFRSRSHDVPVLAFCVARNVAQLGGASGLRLWRMGGAATFCLPDSAVRMVASYSVLSDNATMRPSLMG
jgi:hypothetical protein